MKSKLILALIIGATLALLGTGVALAEVGENIPHGGYDATTNSCLFCHDIHDAAGDYVLMRQSTVTDTCGTCHDVYKTSGAADRWDGSAYPGTQPAVIPGSASWRAVYEVDSTDAGDAGGHKLGQGTDDITYADGEISDGNYIPGGSDTLTALANVAEFGYDPAGTGEDPANATDYEATNGLYCASCHTPHGTFGQLLKDDDGNIAVVESDGQGKLLSARPNHMEEEESTLPTNDWQNEGGINWCAKCHDQRLDELNGGYLHNHPAEYCLSCHGNYNGTVDTAGFPNSADVTDDFPHTSPVQNVLQAVPDELCLRCHVEGEPP